MKKTSSVTCVCLSNADNADIRTKKITFTHQNSCTSQTNSVYPKSQSIPLCYFSYWNIYSKKYTSFILDETKIIQILQKEPLRKILSLFCRKFQVSPCDFLTLAQILICLKFSYRFLRLLLKLWFYLKLI